MNAQTNFSRKLAIALIVLAVFGTEISYHFSLESRFDQIEQKLEQDTVAMQQMQDSIDTLSTSKTETLAGLNKQVEALQSSFEPLGKMSREQTDALSQVRQEVTTLQQAQTQQTNAQKDLSTGIAQLKKAGDEARRAAAAAAAATPPAAPTSAPSPAVTTSPAPTTPPAAPAAAPSSSSADTSHALLQIPGAFSHPTKIAMLPASANTDDAVDVRPADASSDDSFRSVRALPVNQPIER
jgi:septal ring factor EnvC (AmiA/AmiB activator)